MPDNSPEIISNKKNIKLTVYSKRISSWFKEEVFARLVKNAGILLSGNVVSSLLRLASLAIITRALSPADFGLLVLIETYAAIFDLIFNFQSWQTLIKYCADALSNKDQAGFKSLIKFGIFLDVGSAFLATSSAILFAGIFGLLFGWEKELNHLIMFYSLIILFNISGTPTAILRLFDKFKLFSIQSILSSILKLAGVAIAFYNDAGLEGFIYVLMITEIFQRAFLLLTGWLTLKSKGYEDIMKSPLKGIKEKHKGIWNFTLASNVNTTIVNFARRFDKVIVFQILNTEAVAVYKLAESINRLILKIMDPLYFSVYPELAKLVSGNAMKSLNRLLMRTSAIICLVSLLLYIGFFIGIDLFVEIIFGEAYIQVGTIVLFYIFGTLISFIFFYAQPLVLAFGKATAALKINIITVSIYILLLYVLTYYFGLIGSAISFSIFMMLAVFFRIYYIQKKYNVFSLK